MNTLKFKTNINCGNCVKTVTPYLNELDNIDLWKVETEHPDKILTVEIDDNNKAIVVETVRKAGFNIEEL